MNSNFTTDFKKPATFTAQTYGTKTTVEVDHSDLSLDEVMDAFQTLLIGMGYHTDALKSWVIDRADEYRETDAEDLKEKLNAWKFENDDNTLRHSFGEWTKDSEGPEEEYNQKVKQKPWSNLPDDMWERIQKIEAQREDTHCPILPEDESTGALANSSIRERQERQELDKLDNEPKPHYDWDEEITNERIDIIGQNGNEGTHYDEEEIVWGDEDEDEFDDYGKSTTIDKDVVWDWNNAEDTNESGNETEDDNLFESDEWEANDNLKAANERYKKEVRKMNAKEKRDNKK